MEDARRLALRMEQAYGLGDHASARACARELQVLLTREQNAPDAELRGAADRVLLRTEPDPFLLVIGMLGLGLLLWLVYAYAL